MGNEELLMDLIRANTAAMNRVAEAVESNVKKNDHLVMDVWFCDDHATYAKGL